MSEGPNAINGLLSLNIEGYHKGGGSNVAEGNASSTDFRVGRWRRYSSCFNTKQWLAVIVTINFRPPANNGVCRTKGNVYAEGARYLLVPSLFLAYATRCLLRTEEPDKSFLRTRASVYATGKTAD